MMVNTTDAIAFSPRERRTRPRSMVKVEEMSKIGYKQSTDGRA
jgi:hypothetical protein